MKKTVAFVMVLILAISFFAGCKSGDDNAAAPGSGAVGDQPNPSQTGASPPQQTAEGAGNGDNTPAQESRRNHVNLALLQAPDTLDPQMLNLMTATTVCSGIFDSLFYISPKYGQEPRLATSYEISDDGLTYTYHLRPGVLFSDGSPFTANDVVFTWNRQRPDSLREALVKEMVAIDDLTVELRMNIAFNSIHLMLCNIMIVSESAVTAAGDQVGSRPVGTGPFVLDLDTFNIDQVMNFSRNPLYWDPDGVQIDSATYYVITDTLTQYNAFVAGDLDMIVADPEKWPEIVASGKYKTDIGEIGNTTYIIFNTTVAPWNDVRVRQAFNYAVDNEQIIELAFNGLGSPAYTVAPLGLIGGSVLPDDPYYYNPEKAKELFDEAGVTDIGSVMTVAGVTKTILEIIQQNLSDIGVSMTIDILDAPSLTAAKNTGAFTAATATIYLDMEYDLYSLIYTTTGVLNFSRLYNMEVDSLFFNSYMTVDKEARYAIYRQIINLVNAQARHHYVSYGVTTYALDPMLTQVGIDDSRVMLRNFVWD